MCTEILKQDKNATYLQEIISEQQLGDERTGYGKLRKKYYGKPNCEGFRIHWPGLKYRLFLLKHCFKTLMK